MDNSLTNDLNLNKYIEVFVNVYQTWKNKRCSQISRYRRAKAMTHEKESYSNKDKTKFEAIIYNIKEVTDNKTEE